jgi:hypothetical protein
VASHAIAVGNQVTKQRSVGAKTDCRSCGKKSIVHVKTKRNNQTKVLNKGKATSGEYKKKGHKMEHTEDV